MTYLQILNTIKDTALAQPNVNSVVREFLDLNREDAKYSAVVIQDRDGNRDRIAEQDYVTYTWHLGYVDRLTYDESNRDDIISTGINIINNIVNTIRNTWFPELEVSIVDRINTFDQRFTAQCAGVYVVLAVNAQVSDCIDSESTDLYDTYDTKITANGVYHFVPSGRPVDEINITVDVESSKPEESLIETITSNGSYSYTPEEGSVFSDVSIAVDVHPTERLVQTYTTNGTKTITGEFNGGSVNVDVHPSDKLVETITNNGITSFSGEWKDASITVSIPEEKPEESLEKTITSNGSFHYDPSAGSVFSNADITVDVHPSETLSETYTTNGTKTITGEFNGGSVNVDVHPTDKLVKNITSNGTTDLSGEWKDASITVAVPSDQKPEQVGSFEVTEWGSVETFYPDPGYVFSEVEITNNTRVKSYTSTVASNGRLRWSVSEGEALVNSIDISVDVHPSASLSETYTSNGTYNISGEFNGGVVTVAVSGSGVNPSGTLDISENGVYDVYSYASVSVDVPPISGWDQKSLTEGTNEMTNLDNSASFVASYAFYGNRSIQTVNLPYATTVSTYAFNYCRSLSNVNLPMCSYIGDSAFADCYSLSQVSLPVCSFIDEFAFASCSSLTQISLPVCSYIAFYTFYWCFSLSQINLPVCNYIGSYVFKKCINLNEVNLPVCSFIGSYAFADCSALSQVNLPMCSKIAGSAFQNCTNLNEVNLPVCSFINEFAFYNTNLTILTLGSNSVVSLSGSNQFYPTDMLSIYVPVSLVDTYKTATNWSQYSNRIFPIPS